MKKILSAAALILVVILAGVLLLAFGHAKGGKGHGLFGAVPTDPPTNYSYLQISQAIGYLTAGIVNPVNDTIVRSGLNTASTTLCAIQNPYNATSTVTEAFISITTGTTSSAQIIIATSSTAYATSSPLMKTTLAGGLLGLIMNPGIATSSGIGASVGPTGYVVIGLDKDSAVSYGYTYGGLCAARFVAAN